MIKEIEKLESCKVDPLESAKGRSKFEVKQWNDMTTQEREERLSALHKDTFAGIHKNISSDLT